jgi:UDP-N-acetylglucosamine pyrophosphorylase
MLHNIDTLGANLDPGVLGQHILSGKCLTFEVIARRIDDRGGGLARVNGRVRLLEGLAQPRESDEFKLRYYNSMTTWIDVDRFLGVFGLSRQDLAGPEAKIAERIRTVAARLPTYVTIKEVKRRWGHGQEDVFPVSQTEKLWSDMTSLSDANCGFVVVPRLRGQQLKEVAQLDPCMIDGSLEYVKGLCEFLGGSHD